MKGEAQAQAGQVDRELLGEQHRQGRLIENCWVNNKEMHNRLPVAGEGLVPTILS